MKTDMREKEYEMNAQKYRELMNCLKTAPLDFPPKLRAALADGYPVNFCPEKYWPLLCAAVYYDDAAETEASRLLLEEGADPNIIADDGSALYLAILHRRKPEMIELLLMYGADVGLVDYRGQDALTQACMQYIKKGDDYYLSVVRLLIDYGADISAISGKWREDRWYDDEKTRGLRAFLKEYIRGYIKNREERKDELEAGLNGFMR